MSSSDAEHPMDITMDTPATLGPLTRAQARAIETKVKSLLSESFINMHASWVLPHGSVLCIIKYTRDAQADPQVQAQATGEEVVQGREGTTPGIGRSTSKGTKEATDDRSSASDVGRPTDYGRPKCRTSDRHRMSEIPMTESLQIPRTSGGLRTSDTSDV